MGTAGGRPRGRGSIDVLPSGAYRVRVYAGVDPLTGKQPMLTERVAPGPSAGKEAEKVRTRLLRQVDERRSPRTRATVNQLLDRYLDVVELEKSTRRTYQGYIERHIRLVLGPLPPGRVDGEVLDSFYAQLRRCVPRPANGSMRSVGTTSTGRWRILAIPISLWHQPG